MPTTRPPKKNKLAEAYQVARDLRNEIHKAKQYALPLQGEIVGLTNERDMLLLKVKALLELNEKYRAAMGGLVELVHTLAGGK